jgi:hypothetical protein
VPVEIQVQRLVTGRGFDETDARARIANQATREQRRAVADFVIDNSGAPEDLEPQIDRLWEWLTSLAAVAGRLRTGAPRTTAAPWGTRLSWRTAVTSRSDDSIRNRATNTRSPRYTPVSVRGDVACAAVRGRRRLRTCGRPAHRPSSSCPRASTRRPLPDPARHHRVRQERHHRLDHREGAATHAHPRPEQEPGGPVHPGDAEFFPENRVEYFVSYYDYYQPEAYIASSDTYIEKDSSVNDEIDRLRHSATAALLTRRDTIVVASVSCIYGMGDPEEYRGSCSNCTWGSTTTSAASCVAWSTCSTTATT